LNTNARIHPPQSPSAPGQRITRSARESGERVLRVDEADDRGNRNSTPKAPTASAGDPRGTATTSCCAGGDREHDADDDSDSPRSMLVELQDDK
jgi:hypothetical protein